MSFKIAAVAFTAAGLICGQAVAQNATLPHLQTLQGLVYVDQGDGFAPANASTVLHPGDRVMTARGGVAKISYSGGCGQSVDGRSMTVVGGLDCGGGSQLQVTKAVYQGDGSGGGGGGFGGVSTTGMVIGAVALAGIVAVIVGAATDHSNSGNGGSSGGTSGGGTGPVSP